MSYYEHAGYLARRLWFISSGEYSPDAQLLPTAILPSNTTFPSDMEGQHYTCASSAAKRNCFQSAGVDANRFQSPAMDAMEYSPATQPSMAM